MFNISVQVLQVSSEDANKYIGEAEELGKGMSSREDGANILGAVV
jgi:hypothetical protein